LRALIIEARAIAQAEQLGVADSRRAYHHADTAVSVKARCDSRAPFTDLSRRTEPREHSSIARALRNPIIAR
jgi:hypothetical protein